MAVRPVKCERRCLVAMCNVPKLPYNKIWSGKSQGCGFRSISKKDKLVKGQLRDE